MFGINNKVLKNPVLFFFESIINANPKANTFCNTTITENPLKQNFRTYPVDMVYRKANIFQSTILIPKGYKLLTKPENLNIRNDLVKIVYAIDVLNNDKINVIGVYEFKKDVYGISDYFDLKNYFNKIVDKFNEKLVFVKI